MILLDKLLTRLKAAGHRVLVFSQMTRQMDILEDLMHMRGERRCRYSISFCINHSTARLGPANLFRWFTFRRPAECDLPLLTQSHWPQYNNNACFGRFSNRARDGVATKC